MVEDWSRCPEKVGKVAEQDPRARKCTEVTLREQLLKSAFFLK